MGDPDLGRRFLPCHPRQGTEQHSLHRDYHHPKLVPVQHTGLRKVLNVVLDRFSFAVHVTAAGSANARSIAGDIKPFHVHRQHLRLPFEDEYSYLVVGRPRPRRHFCRRRAPVHPHRHESCAQYSEHCGVNLGVSRTLPGRWVSALAHQNEASDSVALLQPDVFHALYEFYHRSDSTPTTAGPPTRVELRLPPKKKPCSSSRLTRRWVGIFGQPRQPQGVQGWCLRLMATQSDIWTRALKWQPGLLYSPECGLRCTPTAVSLPTVCLAVWGGCIGSGRACIFYSLPASYRLLSHRRNRTVRLKTAFSFKIDVSRVRDSPSLQFKIASWTNLGSGQANSGEVVSAAPLA